MALKQLAGILALLCLPFWVHAQQAVLHTNKGDITIELFPDKAPISVANFLEYANSGFYDGTIFHRVMRRFVIQAGGFTRDMVRKPTRDPIVNESNNRLSNERWTVAMARTEESDSATSQFFINMRFNMQLNYRQTPPGYAVFGKVIDGQHVARDIANTATHEVAGMQDVPVEPIVINSVTIREKTAQQ